MDNIPPSLRKAHNGFFCLSSIFSPSYILLCIQKYSMFIGSQLARQRPGFKINCAIIPIYISCNSSSISICTETLKLQVVSQTWITCFFCLYFDQNHVQLLSAVILHHYIDVQKCCDPMDIDPLWVCMLPIYS